MDHSDLELYWADEHLLGKAACNLLDISHAFRGQNPILLGDAWLVVRMAMTEEKNVTVISQRRPCGNRRLFRFFHFPSLAFAALDAPAPTLSISPMMVATTTPATPVIIVASRECP